VHHPLTGHEDAPTVARAVCELAFPYPNVARRRFDLRQWLGKLGVQQFVCAAAERFIFGEAVELLDTEIPLQRLDPVCITQHRQQSEQHDHQGEKLGEPVSPAAFRVQAQKSPPSKAKLNAVPGAILPT
jgi:hypothetical protein